MDWNVHTVENRGACAYPWTLISGDWSILEDEEMVIAVDQMLNSK